MSFSPPITIVEAYLLGIIVLLWRNQEGGMIMMIIQSNRLNKTEYKPHQLTCYFTNGKNNDFF